MFKFYFSSEQITLLLLGSFLLLLSTYFHYFKKKYKTSLFLLITGGFFFFLFASILDPFLNVWDERFHALVAKNMMEHPFKPTLFNPPLLPHVDYITEWNKSNIWLHKQPLFLWQMALSMKIFGVNEFAVRFPSVLLCTALVYFTYKSGKLLVNKDVGFVSSLFIITSFYLLHLVSGQQGMDHNDISFMVYISASIWAFLEYINANFKNKIYWIIVIGIFSGFAILCKWLVGLLVYLGWGVYILQNKKNRLKESFNLIKALTLTALVFLPWQFYIFTVFPTEANFELAYNTKHLYVPVEGHSGDYWFHFDKIKILYGEYVSYLIIPALIIFWIRGKQNTKLIILVFVTAIYLFFTGVVAKMQTYPFVLAMLIYILLATFLVEILKLIPKKIRIYTTIILLLISYFSNVRLDTLQEKHTLWKNNYYVKQLIHNKKEFKKIEKKLPKNTVLFNIPLNNNVECMFYTNLQTYSFVPTKKQCNELISNGYKIAIIINSNKKNILHLSKLQKDIILLENILIHKIG